MATFGNIAPCSTVVWGYLLFGEQTTLLAGAGGLLVLFGIAWASRPARRAPKPVIRIAAVEPEPVPVA